MGLCQDVTCLAEGTVCSPSDGLCHCGSVDGPVCGDEETCDASAVCLPAPVCGSGERFFPGTPIFREVTAEWGLDALGVEGTRLSVADVDGDGRPDLLVRRGGNGSDDFAADGTRRTWLLRNTGSGFEDLTLSSGVRATRGSQGALGRPGEVVAFADVDNDGDVDLYTGMSTGVDGAMPGETSELLLNDGGGVFALGPANGALRRAGDVDIVAGASFIDYDRDGNIDLWVTQHNYVPAGGTNTVFRGDLLYRGDGRGNFVDVTAGVGLVTEDWVEVSAINEARAHSRAWSAAACDLNGDGTPELLAASYGRAPNHLWQGRREQDGRVFFENRSVVSGYAYDDNLEWRDNQFARCFCQANPAAPGCAEVDRPQIVCNPPFNWRHELDREPFRLGGNSGTTVCADIDNDGGIDLLTTEIAHWWAGAGSDHSEILFNDGALEVAFERPGYAALGLTRDDIAIPWDHGDMTAAVLDFDNDGWSDIYIGASDYPGNHGLLYHQTAPRQFVEVSIEDGIDHHRSHGVVFADFDRDGDLDIVVGHSRARCDAARPKDCYARPRVRMFENHWEGGGFIQLDLEGGPGTNRSAIGARVTVTANGVTQTQEVAGGFGHYGAQNDRILHFGLGAACRATVLIRWPNAQLSEETFELPAGYRFRIREGHPPELAP